jgi:hypothetical protein
MFAASVVSGVCGGQWSVWQWRMGGGEHTEFTDICKYPSPHPHSEWSMGENH